MYGGGDASSGFGNEAAAGRGRGETPPYGAPVEISRLGFAVGSYMPEDVVCSDCIRDGNGGKGGAKADLAGESYSGE